MFVFIFPAYTSVPHRASLSQQHILFFTVSLSLLYELILKIGGSVMGFFLADLWLWTLLVKVILQGLVNETSFHESCSPWGIWHEEFRLRGLFLLLWRSFSLTNLIRHSETCHTLSTFLICNLLERRFRLGHRSQPLSNSRRTAFRSLFHITFVFWHLILLGQVELEFDDRSGDDRFPDRLVARVLRNWILSFANYVLLGKLWPFEHNLISCRNWLRMRQSKWLQVWRQ